MNEKAGALKRKAGPDEMREAVAAAGLDAEVVVTSTPDDLRSKVRLLVQAGCERIGIAGGDGTVHLAVQEIACSDTALGILPQGTANNFANALHLPLELPDAIRVLRDARCRPVDLGKVDAELFTESAGVGLFADSLAIYGRGTNKNLWRGLYALVCVVCSLRPQRLRLTLDGKTYEERAVLCEVANAYRMGAAMAVAPGASVKDGALDVVTIGALTRGELLRYYRAFRRREHRSLPKVRTLRARTVEIEAAHGLHVHCDDRVIGRTPVHIEVQPGALKVLVDRP